MTRTPWLMKQSTAQHGGVRKEREDRKQTAIALMFILVIRIFSPFSSPKFEFHVV